MEVMTDAPSMNTIAPTLAPANVVPWTPWQPIKPAPNNDSATRLTSLYVCINSSSMDTPECVSAVLAFSLCLFSLLVGIASAIRIIYISKRPCTIHLNMNIVVNIYLAVLMLYIAYESSLAVYITYNLMRVLSMYSVVAFVSLSVIRFHVCPPFITQRVVIAILFFFLCLPLIPFVYTLQEYYKKLSPTKPDCGDFALLVFASIECGIAIIIFIQIVSILYLYYHRTSLTSYVTRQAKPIFLLTSTYTITSVGFLAIRSFVYWTTRDDESKCHRFRDFVYPTLYWVILIGQIVHLILPPWTFFWYFYSTIQPRVDSIKPLNFDGTDDDIDERTLEENSEEHEEFINSFNTGDSWKKYPETPERFTVGSGHYSTSIQDEGGGSGHASVAQSPIGVRYNSYVTSTRIPSTKPY